MIGIIGGSGFYNLMDNARKLSVETPFGSPSSQITIGHVAGEEVAFLARHGEDHKFPPHKVPYRANIWALHELGVKQIITSTAVGSLKAHIRPGDILIPDQFVNMTRREDTFYTGKDAHDPKLHPVTHISSASPYCEDIRRILVEAAEKNL